jgi:hypothetical protein
MSAVIAFLLSPEFVAVLWATVKGLIILFGMVILSALLIWACGRTATARTASVPSACCRSSPTW